MKNKAVLILEDRALLREQLTDICRDQGFDVYDCRNIYEAKETWEANQSNIDFIIADMNMDSSGLTADEIAISKNGKFSGWLWVNNYAIAQGFPPEKVIILSEYNRDLSNYINSTSDESHKKNYNVMKSKKHLIGKGDPNGATNTLLKILKR